MVIFKMSKLDISNINYQIPEKIADNTFVAPLHTSHPFIFETPVMSVFGAPIETSTDMELNLQFSVNDEKFYNFIRAIDEYNIDYIHKHSEDWFETQFSRSIILEFYESCIHNWLDEKKNIEIPFIKLIIPKDKLSKLIGDSKITDWNHIHKHIQLSCLIELKGLYFLKQRLIMDLNIQKINIQDNGRVNLTKHLNKHKNAFRNNVIDDEMVNELAISRDEQENKESQSNPIEFSTSQNKSQSSSDSSEFRGELLDENEFNVSLSNPEEFPDSDQQQILEGPNNTIDKPTLNQEANNEDDILSSLKYKKTELEKVISEASQANKLAQNLNQEALKRASEIESISRTLPHF